MMSFVMSSCACEPINDAGPRDTASQIVTLIAHACAGASIRVERADRMAQGLRVRRRDEPVEAVGHEFIRPARVDGGDDGFVREKGFERPVAVVFAEARDETRDAY